MSIGSPGADIAQEGTYQPIVDWENPRMLAERTTDLGVVNDVMSFQ